MQIGARIQIIIELFDIFHDTSLPFDIILAKFFKNNKWIGSHDRHYISEFCYAMFRDWSRIKFSTKDITCNFGRFYVLSFLKLHNQLNIDEIFCGKKYHPICLNFFEQKFVKTIPHNFPTWAELNYPEWLEERLHKIFPTNFVEEMNALNCQAAVDIRINTLKTSRDEVMQKLQSSGMQCEETKYAQNGVRIFQNRIPRDYELLRNGYIEIQDEGSQLIAEICAPNHRQIVVDFCAGAGGKTLALATLMQNKGRLYAFDVHAKRLALAQKRMKRAGVNNVTCEEISHKWIKRHLEFADIVLVDAPCSGTGTWRRNPDMRAKFSSQDLSELIDKQESILQQASSLVKYGGKLVYATCSLLQDENENQIFKFLKNNKQFSLLPVTIIDGKPHQFLRLSPYRNGTDGFFVATMIKN